MRGVLAAAATVAAMALATAGRAGDDLVFLSVGAGELDGGYHQVARALCDAVNARHRGALRCSPETTPGSRYNLEALIAGQLDVALIQSDVAAQAAAGPDGGFAPLRRLASLYPEALTVLVRAGVAASGPRDLRGRVVDIGPPGSGRNATVRHVLAETGMGRDFFGALVEAPAASGLAALCAGRIDAMALVVGHPSALVADAVRDCGARLAPMAGPGLDALAAADPSFFRATIEPYGDGPPTPTISVRALLMVRADAAEDVARSIVAALLADLPTLSRATPPLRGLTAATLEGPAEAPALHAGAAAAFAAAR